MQTCEADGSPLLPEKETEAQREAASGLRQVSGRGRFCVQVCLTCELSPTSPEHIAVTGISSGWPILGSLCLVGQGGEGLDLGESPEALLGANSDKFSNGSVGYYWGYLLVFLIETRDRCNNRRCLADEVCERALKAVTKISEWFTGKFVSPQGDMFEGGYTLLGI